MTRPVMRLLGVEHGPAAFVEHFRPYVGQGGVQVVADIKGDDQLFRELATPATLVVFSGHSIRQRGESLLGGTKIDEDRLKFDCDALWLDGCHTAERDGDAGQPGYLTPLIRERLHGRAFAGWVGPIDEWYGAKYLHTLASLVLADDGPRNSEDMLGAMQEARMQCVPIYWRRRLWDRLTISML